MLNEFGDVSPSAWYSSAHVGMQYGCTLTLAHTTAPYRGFLLEGNVTAAVKRAGCSQMNERVVGLDPADLYQLSAVVVMYL